MISHFKDKAFYYAILSSDVAKQI